MSFAPIKDGEYTSTIYSLIRDNRYNDVIRILQYEVGKAPNNQAGLSLLAYCYYYTEDYVNAAMCYDKLSGIVPQQPRYKLYHAQALYNAHMFTDALGVIAQIEDADLVPEVIKLEACIKYSEEDIRNARVLVEQYVEDDPDIEVNIACLEYKENNYDKALQRFVAVGNRIGFSADLSYGIALCHYRRAEYGESLRYIVDIIDTGSKEHPELGVGTASEGIEMRSVGNSLLLHETCLIEALNLKFAIEHEAKSMERAAEALTDMPPRAEEEWDAVTLHNHALIAVDSNPADALAKLQFLLGQTPFPPEAFGNLLLLYCKYEYLDLAADVLAENAHLTYKYLTPFMFEYLDAMISVVASPEDALAKLDALSTQALHELRKLSKVMQGKQNELRAEADMLHVSVTQLPSDQTVSVRKDMKEYDAALERYVSVVMAAAKIYWDRAQYGRIEKLFQVAVEFLSEHPVFRLNAAHMLFMQANKYSRAASFYEPIVNKGIDNILEIPAIVLANLCVCYIMSNQNDEAEELIRKAEREEEQVSMMSEVEGRGEVKSYHTCIINLVIGTLYCNKSNFEFGLGRVIKAMEPYGRRLGTDTWFYAKRCILATLEALSKHLVMIRDALVDDLLEFLAKCEEHGEDIPGKPEGPLLENQIDSAKNTVAYEARQLRALVLDIFDY